MGDVAEVSHGCCSCVRRQEMRGDIVMRVMSMAWELFVVQKLKLKAI